MYLNKEQFCLLKRICSCEEMIYSSLSNQEKIISEFLCNEHFISISRESFPHFSGKFRIGMANRFLQKSQNRENLT